MPARARVVVGVALPDVPDARAPKLAVVDPALIPGCAVGCPGHEPETAEVPDDFRTTIRRPSGAQEKTLAQVQLLLNPDAYLAKRGIPLSDRHRYRLLAEAAETLAVLHGHGIAVGDLSPKNVLFALAPETRCFFVDADAMRLAGRSALAQAETPDWEVRAVSTEELATPQSDAYKFGLLVLRLLAGDQSTRDPARLPARVPAAVRTLVERTLVPTPGSRPALADWAAPLRAAATTASAAVPTVPVPAKPAVPAPVPQAPRPAAPPLAVVAQALPSFPAQPPPASAPEPGRRRWPWVVAAVAVAGWVILGANPRLFGSAAATPAPTAIRLANQSPAPVVGLGSPAVGTSLPTVGTNAIGTVGPGTAAPSSLRAKRGDIDDRVGLLSPDQSQAIGTALDELSARTGVGLWLVFVRSTSDGDAVQTAEDEAAAKGLGGTDLLILVAVNDHAYGFWKGTAVPLADEALNSLFSESAAPAFRQANWAAGVLALITSIGTSVLQH